MGSSKVEMRSDVLLGPISTCDGSLVQNTNEFGMEYTKVNSQTENSDGLKAIEKEHLKNAVSGRLYLKYSVLSGWTC